MPKIFEYTLQVNHFLWQHSIKQSEQCLNIGSGYLFIQKSFEKQSQPIKIRSLDLLYPISLRLSSLFLNQNTIV